MFHKVKQIKLASVSTSGTIAIPVKAGQYNRMLAQLNVTAASGTNPTLDVAIQDSLDGTNYDDFLTFAQASGVDRQRRSNNEHYEKPCADVIRINYVVGGTTPSFDFTIDIQLND